MHRFFKLTVYVVYLVAATGLFLYIQFPSDTVMRYLSSYTEAAYPGIRISMRNIHPTLPLGVSIESGAISFQDMPLVRMDAIRFSPILLSLFKPAIQVQFFGTAHQGRFTGIIEFVKNNHPVRYRVDAGLSGVEMNDIPVLQNLTGKRFSGKCDGRVEYNPEGKGGRVSARIKALNCKFKLASPEAKIESLSFQQVHANLAFDNEGLTVTELLFKGRQVDGVLSGSIALKKPVGKSVVKLSGEMTPHAGFLTALGDDMSTQLLSTRSRGDVQIEFRIEGTVEEPIFSF